MTGRFVQVADLDEIPQGTCRAYELAGLRLVLSHLDDGIHAIENRCSHLDSPLATGRIYKGGQIACPIHGARFDLRSGAAKSPPAFLPVAVFRTRIRDGRVEIEEPG